MTSTSQPSTIGGCTGNRSCARTPVLRSGEGVWQRHCVSSSAAHHGRSATKIAHTFSTAVRVLSTAMSGPSEGRAP